MRLSIIIMIISIKWTSLHSTTQSLSTRVYWREMMPLFENNLQRVQSAIIKMYIAVEYVEY